MSVVDFSNYRSNRLAGSGRPAAIRNGAESASADDGAAADNGPFTSIIPMILFSTDNKMNEAEPAVVAGIIRCHHTGRAAAAVRNARRHGQLIDHRIH